MQPIPPTILKSGSPLGGMLKALTILVLVVAAYCPVWHAGFIWDDDDYVTNNRTLRNAEGLKDIWFEFGATPQYYPLVHTTFWIEYRLWGLNPTGYHVINVLFHALGSLLLWRVLLRLQLPGAWLAAAIFAVHPVHVESVAWITERKNVLSGAFYFAAALVYLRFWEMNDANGSNARRKWFRYAGAMFLFLCALFSKTVTCSLPAALLLVRWWKTGRLKWRDIYPLLPFFALGIALGLITARMEKLHVGAQGVDWAFSFWDRCLIAGRAVWFYANKLFWPDNLTFIYPRWNISTTAWWQWLFPLLALAVVAALWRLRHRMGRGPLVAVLFFGGTLLPALGFANVYPMLFSFVADHFQYLASIGLVVLSAAGLSRVKWRLELPLLALLVLLSWRQCHIYQSLETLWSDTLDKNPSCWLAHNNYGLVLAMKGNLEDAESHYRRALELRPSYADAWNNLGQTLHASGRAMEAVECYKEAIRFNPNMSSTFNNVGVVLNQMGKHEAAEVFLRQAVALSPMMAQAHANLAEALREQGKMDAAIEHGIIAVRLNPGSVSLRIGLGKSYARMGRLTDAIREFREALKISPADGLVNLNLGDALALAGDDFEAKKHYRLGLESESQNADGHFGLGVMLAKEQDLENAVHHLRTSLTLNPNHVPALNSLAWLLATRPMASSDIGNEALKHAQHAASLTERRNPAILDTLAAAYAQCGRFDEATDTAANALDLLQTQPNSTLRQKIQTRLELYHREKPWRE